METTDPSGHMTSVMRMSLYELIRTETLDCLLKPTGSQQTEQEVGEQTRMLHEADNNQSEFYRLKTGMFVLFVD